MKKIFFMTFVTGSVLLSGRIVCLPVHYIRPPAGFYRMSVKKSDIKSDV